MTHRRIEQLAALPYLILDFDGTVCDVHACLPDRVAAQRLRDILAEHGVPITSAIEHTPDPLAVLRYTATIDRSLVTTIDHALIPIERDSEAYRHVLDRLREPTGKGRCHPRPAPTRSSLTWLTSPKHCRPGRSRSLTVQGLRPAFVEGVGREPSEDLDHCVGGRSSGAVAPAAGRSVVTRAKGASGGRRKVDSRRTRKRHGWKRCTQLPCSCGLGVAATQRLPCSCGLGVAATQRLP
jgi:hypothetical protein